MVSRRILREFPPLSKEKAQFFCHGCHPCAKPVSLLLCASPMPATFRDYYETLGLKKEATHEEVRTAFRKLARKYHPDVAKDKKAAEEKFKEINEAYEVLSDPEKRKKYDSYGQHWEQMGKGGGEGYPGAGGGASWQGFPGGYAETSGGDGVEFEFGGTGFSDFFEQMFGARRGQAYSRGGGFGFDAGPQRGRDIEADLMVTIEEALNGSSRQISFRRSDTGKTETYTVKVPKGVREGQRIRLAGVGGSGSGGGASGDLFLRVKLQKHPDFHVEGSDLIHDLEIPAYDAVLGCEMRIPTLDGAAKLRIPAGTQAGKRFRLPGKGLPQAGGSRGDLYVVVDPQLPSNPSEDEKRLWQQIAQFHRSNA
jgi:curved DNA-binding protein